MIMKTLVLDTAYMPRRVETTERAFVIKYKGNAEVVSEYDDYFKFVDKSLKIKKPSIIKVFTFININYNKVPLSRNNIFKRDGFECVYCGSKKDLTLDHVLPKSKGGNDSWDNLVSCCKKCNNEKDDLLLEEWGKEIPKPLKPHALMLMQNLKNIPEDWKPFLFL